MRLYLYVLFLVMIRLKSTEINSDKEAIRKLLSTLDHTTINTIEVFPHLNFKVPNVTNFWLWDEKLEKKYWRTLSKWNDKPLKKKM
ncbi:hypothetical protein O3M35_010786 [Rhynocoris fuscipes]|uniref:Uncharacterized protein n=1 Tax=Rhynocoris fuscipes TaxID=488301 RepID=A0AAW1D6F0_9HEMI